MCAGGGSERRAADLTCDGRRQTSWWGAWKRLCSVGTWEDCSPADALGWRPALFAELQLAPVFIESAVASRQSSRVGREKRHEHKQDEFKTQVIINKLLHV